MTIETVVTPDETPSDDTTVVVAPTIVVETGADDDAATDESVEEAVEEAVEEVEDRQVDLSIRLGMLEDRVSQLEVPVVAEALVDETPTETVIEVSEEGDGDVEVVVDNTPATVPWTHRNPFKGRG